MNNVDAYIVNNITHTKGNDRPIFDQQMPTKLRNTHELICILRWPVVRSSADDRPTVHIFNVNARRRPNWESPTV